MNISTLVCLTSLKHNQAEMISRFLKSNNLTISTFVIVSKNQLLEHNLSPDAPKTVYVQAGHRIEKNKINPNKFFFALMNGCGLETTVIIPNPQEFKN